MPSNTRLTSLAGTAELEDLSGKAASRLPKKSLVMRLELPIPPTGETPREVDDLLASLRDSSRLRRDFPGVELRDLKTTKGGGKGSGPVASYSIVCLPKPPSPRRPSRAK